MATACDGSKLKRILGAGLGEVHVSQDVTLNSTTSKVETARGWSSPSSMGQEQFISPA